MLRCGPSKLPLADDAELKLWYPFKQW